MKKYLLAICVVFLFATTIYAVSAQPGTEDDPLVSKSYVDAQIAAMKSAAGSNFAVVHVDAGKKVVGGEGTEMIVRAGEAIVYAEGSNGVADLTTGEDLRTGQEAKLNHLLLIPRGDGRGITAGSELYIMVRGSYTIQ